MTASGSTPAISIVIASADPGPVIHDCLAALAPQREHAEVIVADGSRDDTAAALRERFPWVRVVEFPHATSLPRLRGLGMAAAVAPVIGILDPWCIPATTWIQRAVTAHEERAELVIGGPVALHSSRRHSYADWAAYLFDYWEFVPPFPAGAVNVLAGNNITYKRAALPDAATLQAEGFWKAFTNARLRQAGHSLRAAEGLDVALNRAIPPGDFFRSRFHHGRSYAAMRVRGRGFAARLRFALLTPALPLLFLARQARGLMRKPVARVWFVFCAPALLAFHLSWACGELCGYVAGAGRSDDAIRS